MSTTRSQTTTVPAPSHTDSEVEHEEWWVRTHAAALNVELRSPLARIELATSQLARESLTPIARRYAEQIFEAVVQIDELVERSLRVLVPRPPRANHRQALGPTMADLRRRFEPALEACAVSWVTDAAGEKDVVGDPQCFRTRVCELLRFVLVICEGGGRIETALKNGKNSGTVFKLAIARNEPFEAHRFQAVRDQFDYLRARMLEAGVRVGGELGSRSSHIELIWPSVRGPKNEPAELEG